MSGAQIYTDAYHLAAESDISVRGALAYEGCLAHRSALSGALLEKYTQMQLEYHLWALRMQEISRRAEVIPPDALIAGLAGEAARAALVSGHLALASVLPAELMRLLITKWTRGDRGAAELAHRNSGEGSVDTSANAGSASFLSERSEECTQLCKAGYLKNARDGWWWTSTGTSERTCAAPILDAAQAAEYILRAPQIVWKSWHRSSPSRTQCAVPRPLADIMVILTDLTELDASSRGLCQELEAEQARRVSWLNTTHVV